MSPNPFLQCACGVTKVWCTIVAVAGENYAWKHWFSLLHTCLTIFLIGCSSCNANRQHEVMSALDHCWVFVKQHGTIVFASGMSCIWLALDCWCTLILCDRFWFGGVLDCRRTVDKRHVCFTIFALGQSLFRRCLFQIVCLYYVFLLGSEYMQTDWVIQARLLSQSRALWKPSWFKLDFLARVALYESVGNSYRAIQSNSCFVKTNAEL